MQIPSISQFSEFFFRPLNLWSFKTAGRQTASCLKFMKYLFNSPGWDLSWQPFTFPYLNAASLTFVRPALDATWRSMTHYSPRSFTSSSRALWSEGAAISAAHIEASERHWRTGSDGQNVTEDFLKAGLPWHSVTYASVSMTTVRNISTFPKVRGDNWLPWHTGRTLKGWKTCILWEW